MKFEFARATKKATYESLPVLAKIDSLIVQEKFDGTRFGAEIVNGTVKLLSRNNLDRAVNVPYIVEALLATFPDGTVLDGEVVHLHEAHEVRWELSRSVMGTNDYNPNVPKAQYVIYDIQHLRGESLMTTTYSVRREILKSYFTEADELPTTLLNGNGLAMPRSWKLSKAPWLWDYVVGKGGEGLMIKDSNEAVYAKSWTKVKKAVTVDAFVIGIEKGKGKFEGQIGSLVLGVHDLSGSVVEIGKCSGMTDSERKQFTDMAIAETLKGLVVEVGANEITKNLKLRHPNFLRVRTDKMFKDCSITQLQATE